MLACLKPKDQVIFICAAVLVPMINANELNSDIDRLK
jgi:hypothetical protein